MLATRSPTQLAQLAFAASFAPLLLFTLDLLPVPPAKQTDTVLGAAILLLCGTVFFGGFAIDLLLEHHLKAGRAAGRWTDLEFDRALTWITQPAFRYGQQIFFVLYYSVFVFDLVMRRNVGALGITIFPALAVSRLTNALKPLPPTPSTGPRQPPAPLYSDQWGQSA